MPKAAVSKPDTEVPITPPPDSSEVNDADISHLEQLQDSLFAKTEEPVGDAAQAKPKEKKSRASEIIEKTQELDAVMEGEPEPKKSEPKKKGTSDDFEVPTFVDVAAIFKQEDDGGKGKEVEPEPDIDLDKETNIKNLRQVAGRFKTERDEIKTQLSELEAKLKEHPEVAGLQSQLNKLETRIKELEPFELVFGLHNNPEFKEKYLDSANSIISEMKAIAKDYDVEEDVIEELLITTSRKEADQILEESFSSSSARGDIKVLKQKYDGIQRERTEFEKKPREALLRFQSQQEEKTAQNLQRRNVYFEQTVAEEWGKALTANKELPREKRIPELVEIPGNKEHNEKVARPAMATAQEMFLAAVGHIEKVIRNQAILDKPFVNWLATVCQQASATQHINYSRFGLYQKYQELEKKTQKQEGFSRPGVSAPSRHAPVSSNGKKRDGKAIAAEIFESVMADD